MGVIKAAEPGQQIYTFSLRFKLFLQQFLRFVLRLSEEKANLGDKVFRGANASVNRLAPLRR